MYDGTIAANWKALVTFQQMIVLCSADGVIDMTPPALSRRTGIPLDIIEDGIAYLESTDPYSRSQEEEGRRIVRLDNTRNWGWVIVNHHKYKMLVSKSARSEYDRKRYERLKGERLVDGVESGVESVEKGTVPESSTRSRHTDTDTDTDTDKNKKRTLSSSVSDVFSFWQSELKHPRARLDDKRKQLIGRALKVGYTVDDLKDAITGCKKSEFHMGKNDNGRIFDGIDLIFRNADKIDAFVLLSEGRKINTGKIKRSGFTESDYRPEI